VARYFLFAAVVCIPAAALAGPPISVLSHGVEGVGPIGEGIGMGPGIAEGPGPMYGPNHPSCERGTIFKAVQVTKAYRDNEAFAFKFFEGKKLEISGRLIAVKRDTIIDEATKQVVFDGFVALVTPDGKPPKPVGLEFRFPIEKLKADPDLACQVANLWAGQFVTLRGTCTGAIKDPGYVAVIFADSELAR
jgi:hypothetical protein